MSWNMFHIDLFSSFGEKSFKTFGFQTNMAAKHMSYGIENLDSAHDFVED